MKVFKRKEPLFKYDSENLVYRKTNRLLKYKLSVIILTVCFSATLISAMKLKTEIYHKEQVIKEKEQRIKIIKQPLREENYVEDLYKNIGFTLTSKQYKKFSELSLKYRNQIEEAKIPATLVWWVAFKESGFDVDAKSSTSTACGQFQFLKGTWSDMCKFKGVDTSGRFNEQKQVDIMLTYLNYHYHKEKDWKRVMSNFHGGEYLYPVTFLLK